MKGKTVFVGLSGGVDSSVAAYLLKRDGWRVVGVYMKNWSSDVGDWQCPWREDYLAAKRLAAFLDIEFLRLDFERQYKRAVVDEMIAAYRQGLTPNPDALCNQRIKFGLFFNACRRRGADMVSTGHYARLSDGRLCRSRDPLKDQTYFLYALPRRVLPHLLFPLGDYLKSQTRALAAEAGLPNADRAESMGICFVGQVGLADFLGRYIKLKPGGIIDADDGRPIGRHRGAALYTLGQRHGLAVGGGLPYYVVGKDMAKNEVYVSRDLNHERLWASSLEICQTNWLMDEPVSERNYDLRVRHGGKLFKAQLRHLEMDARRAVCEIETPVLAAAAGQVAVLYDGQSVFGGGLIC